MGCPQGSDEGASSEIKAILPHWMARRDVWWINHYALTPNYSGGTRHYDLATELGSRSTKVTVFACDVALDTRKRRSLGPKDLYRIEEFGNARFVWINAAEYQANDWRRFLNIYTFSRNLKRTARILGKNEGPGIVIGSSPHLGAAVDALDIAQRQDAPFLAELRDLWPQALVDMGSLSEKHPFTMLMRRQEAKLYKGAKGIIVLAKGSMGYLEKRGIDRDSMLYLPNGIHGGSFSPNLARAEARQKFDMTKFTVVYAGAHGPANALDTIVRAALLVDPATIEFLLVGNGPSKSSLKALAASLKSPVRFMSSVPKSEVPNLLLAADAAAITLQNIDAFGYGVSPNKLFDYMGASKPVLCAVPGDMAALVEEAKCGVVTTPEDPVAFAGGARKLADSSENALAEMGERGRQLVQDQFDRRKLADRLIGYLDKMAG